MRKYIYVQNIEAVMIKVSFLIGNLNKEHGGAQQLLYDLCQHLPEKFNLTVYYMFGDGTFRSDFETTGARVVALEANSNYDIRAFTRLIGDLQRENPDILHTNSPISGSWGRVAGRLAGIPHIISVQHAIHDSRDPFARAIDDITLPLADTVVGVNKEVISSFAEWERLFLYNTDTQTIMNGIDVDWIEAACRSQNTHEVLEPYPIDPTDQIIGSVGRHVEMKGYRYLIDAMPSVIRKHPNAKLILVGDGPEREKLERQTKQRNIDSSVVFVGYQSAVPPFLACFDIGVFPSLNESFGLALGEAMAAGVPVIASDIPAFREVVDSAGKLIESGDPEMLADAINDLLDDQEQRNLLARSGHKRIKQHFSIRYTAQKYSELYRVLLNG